MFEKGELCFTVPMNLMDEVVGIINPVSLDNRVDEVVNRFKREYLNLMPFFVMINTEMTGPLITVLFVSDCEEEWPNDKEELKSKYLCAFTYNLEYDFWEGG